MQAGEVEGQLPSFAGRKKEALAPVARAGTHIDIAAVEQVLHHAIETLFGDLEDVQQLGHRQSRPAADEVQHPVMRAAEAEAVQQTVCIAHEIAVGEEQKLDQVEQRRRRGTGAGRMHTLVAGAQGLRQSHLLSRHGKAGRNKVSIVDIIHAVLFS